MMCRKKTIFVIVLVTGVFLTGSLSAYYESGRGRWLNRDPVDELGRKVLIKNSIEHQNKTGKNENPYTFILNNPINYIDPFGLYYMRPCTPEARKPCEKYCSGKGKSVNDCIMVYLTCGMWAVDCTCCEGQKAKFKSVPRKLRDMIEKLRKGMDVEVDTAEEARKILDQMDDIKPYTETNRTPNPDGRMRDGFSQPNGTYRGDLINKTEEHYNKTVHPEIQDPKHPHKTCPHYNIRFHDGKEASIIIKGGK